MREESEDTGRASVALGAVSPCDLLEMGLTLLLTGL